MADINSNIKVNIDTSDALAQLKLLQQQISAFQQAMRNAGAQNASAAAAMQQNLITSINATGKFRANVQTIKTSAESFTESLEKNKFSIGEYFRYAGGASKTFGKLFKSEYATITQVAKERVKELQTQYIKLGRDATGAMKAIAVKPLSLDMTNLATKTQIAAQKQQLFNQLMTQGSTSLLNFGKNTQWAGRQLMVGFTIPLTMMGSAAAKAYMQIEQASVKFRRVYGDMNTTTEEANKMVKSVQSLANEFTKYGVAVADTMDMAAQAAAMGKTGADLIAQINNAAKLSILGGVDQTKALETTISLTNAFGVAAEDLGKNIDFLNAVENQTTLSIDDLTTAIPKAAPVVKQLGGDVKDLAFFMTAMKEGGINASEGANAIKSGLASLINPSEKASKFLQGFGINVKGIVEADKGNLKKTVVDFAKALDTLDPLNRARAIEQMFGKFQFSRLSTLFQNVIAEGSQASQVAELSKNSAEELAILSEREMKKISDSPMFKFQKSMQDMQAKLAPVGEAFLKAVTPIIEFVSKILDGFNNLGEGTKNFVSMLVLAVAGIGPVLLMTFGLIANGVANIMKLFTNMKGFINKTTKPSDILGEQTSYMTTEQLKGAAVAASLDQAHAKLRQTFTSEKAALDELTRSYRQAVEAQQQYSGVPGIPTGNPNAVPKRYANGVSMVPGPRGAGDIIPALLSPGEAVIPAKHAQKYAPVIAGMVAGNLPGFEDGTTGVGMRQSTIGPLTQKQTEGMLRTGKSLKEISDEVYAGPYGAVPPEHYVRQIEPTSGHSFPAFQVGGIYEKADGTKVFVKPQVDLVSAMAEVRGTQIARDAHQLITPQQKIVTMMDPTDPEGKRKFIALESQLNEQIANISTSFTKQQYIKQLVASLLRGDKDLGIGNLGGDILADVGTAGVFQTASGKRKLGGSINSMEEQAIINLLGVKGGAKRFFAESTAEIAKSMTPAEYDAAMKAEIQSVMPRLQTTIAGFGNLNPEEKAAYMAMQQRLQAGMGVDWGKYQAMHSAVTPKKYALGGIVGYDGGTNNVKHESDYTPQEIYELLKIQETHAYGEMNINDPKVQEQLKRVFAESTPEDFNKFKVLSNLTISLPGKLNQLIKETNTGVSGPIFSQAYNALRGKLSKTAKMSGVKNMSDAQILEDIIGTRFAGESLIKDSIFAGIVEQTINEQTANTSGIGGAANLIWERTKQVGTVRPKRDGLDAPKWNDLIRTMLQNDELVLVAGTDKGFPVAQTPFGGRFGRIKADGIGSSKTAEGRALRKLAQDAANAWARAGNKSAPLPIVQDNNGNMVPLTWRDNSAKPGSFSTDDFPAYDDTSKKYASDLSFAPGGFDVLKNLKFFAKGGVVPGYSGGTSGAVPAPQEFLLAKLGQYRSQVVGSDTYSNAAGTATYRDKSLETYESVIRLHRDGQYTEAYKKAMNLFEYLASVDEKRVVHPGLQKTGLKMEQVYPDLYSYEDAIAAFKKGGGIEKGIEWEETEPIQLSNGGIIPGYAKGSFGIPGMGQKKSSYSDAELKHNILLELVDLKKQGLSDDAVIQSIKSNPQFALALAQSKEASSNGRERLNTASMDRLMRLRSDEALDNQIARSAEYLEQQSFGYKAKKIAKAAPGKIANTAKGVAYGAGALTMAVGSAIGKTAATNPAGFKAMTSGLGQLAKMVLAMFGLHLNKGGVIPGYANGVFSVPGPKGAGDVVPAMLSPGEAVIPANRAAQHRGLIKGMIAGNLPGYAKGTIIPGYVDGKDEVKRIPGMPASAVTVTSFDADSQAMLAEQSKVVALEEALVAKKKEITRLSREQIEEQMATEDKSYRELIDKRREFAAKLAMTDEERLKQQENEKRILEKEEVWMNKKNVEEKKQSGLSKLFTRSKFTGKVQGAMYGATAAVGAVSAMGGPIGEAAGAALPAIGAMTGAMSMIPGPAGMVVGGLMAVATISAQVDAHFKKIREESYNLAQSMGAGNKAIMKFAEFAKKVSATEIVDKQRAESSGQFFNIVAGKKTFGQSFMEGESGKGILESVNASIKNGGTGKALEQMAQQLSSAVVSGVLTSAQAKSVAEALGARLKNLNFGIKVSARINALFGPKGENLEKDPVNTRINFTKGIVSDFVKNTEQGEFKSQVVDDTYMGIKGTMVQLVRRSAEEKTAIGGMLAAQYEQIPQIQQQALDSLDLLYQKRISDAEAAGKTAEAIRLQNEFLVQQQKLLERNTAQSYLSYAKLAKLKKDSPDVYDAAKKASEEGFTKHFEGTGREAEAVIAKSAIDNLGPGATDTQRITMRSAVTSDQLGLAQATDLSNILGHTAEGNKKIREMLLASPVMANRAATFAGNLKDEATQYKFLMSMETKDPAKAEATLDALELFQKTTGIYADSGDTKMVEMMLTFATNNEGILSQINTDMNELETNKVITIDLIEKYVGADVAGSMGGQKSFNLLNYKTKNERMTFTTEYTTLYRMYAAGDTALLARVNTWLAKPENKGKTQADYFATQADLTVQTRTADFAFDPNASNDDNSNQKESSWLDQYVKTARDAGKATQALTTGFADSGAALKKFGAAAPKLNGLFTQLKAAGASNDIIQAALGGDEATTKALIDTKTGKLKAGAKQILAGINKAILQQKEIDWLGLNAAERKQKYNDMYSADLEVLKISEDEINKRYDDRIKALDTINTLNERNSAQQQSTLTLADALAKGDIAAAARAALDKRKQDTSFALEDQKKNLELARTLELSKLVVDINGVQMTRAEVEEKIRINAEAITKAKAAELELGIRIGQLAEREYSAVVNPVKKATGGLIMPKGYAYGGGIYGTDTVPAMLTPGEFVVKKSSVDAIGIDKLNTINSGNMPSDSVYNYSINVNVASGADANDIAKAVMTQIRQIESQRVRSNTY